MADRLSNAEAAFHVCVGLKKTASVFATLRAIFHLENQSSKTRRCLLIALATSLGSVWDAKIAVSSANTL
ncbi:hypothetical protein TNCV_3891301 [Trichonephila clavipes]|nr:hypothetical protein TNCV_3891301 [Trichonephila clavipes]